MSGTRSQNITPMVSSAPILQETSASTESYDRLAWLYDAVVGSWLYHRLMWGTPPRVHADFAREALRRSGPGKVLDAGSGSLLFTARVYRSFLQAESQLTLLDASRSMLERARRRLGKYADSGRVTLTQGNLLELPWPGPEFETIFHFGVLHCIEAPERVLAELHRVLLPQGELWLSVLVLGRARGDRYLGRLHRAGHVARPLAVTDVVGVVGGAGFVIEELRTRGSLVFLHARKLLR